MITTSDVRVLLVGKLAEPLPINYPNEPISHSLGSLPLRSGDKWAWWRGRLVLWKCVWHFDRFLLVIVGGAWIKNWHVSVERYHSCKQRQTVSISIYTYKHYVNKTSKCVCKHVNMYVKITWAVLGDRKGRDIIVSGRGLGLGVAGHLAGLGRGVLGGRGGGKGDSYQFLSTWHQITTIILQFCSNLYRTMFQSQSWSVSAKLVTT